MRVWSVLEIVLDQVHSRGSVSEPEACTLVVISDVVDHFNLSCVILHVRITIAVADKDVANKGDFCCWNTR